MTPSGPRAPLAVRLYAALARLLLDGSRGGYARDAAKLFEELHADAVRERGRLAAWRMWLRSAALLIACAARERRGPSGTTGARRRGEGMGKIVQDVRHGIRGWVKRPAFALTAVLILGVGIGATTAIFSVVDAVVLRPLPYPEADRLVHFDRGNHSYPALRAWLEMSSFESIAAVRDDDEDDVDLTGAGTPERLTAVSVSAEFFRMFGGTPHLGRLFDAGDYPGDRSVAVLDHGFWRRRWGGDPAVVGSTLIIDGAPSVVVGVLDPAFRNPELQAGREVDIWFPLDDGGWRINEYGSSVLAVVGRLAPGVSLEAAQAEVDAQQRAFAEQVPRLYVGRDGSIRQVPLVPLREAISGHVSSTLFTLLGAVGLLLLIACANVANLFLAHGTTRTREISLRAALGATRGRIASQVLTESVVLALAGGALGVTLAYGGVELLRTFSPGDVPRIDALGVDLRILGFSLLVSILTGVLFGMLPAIQAARADVNDALKEGAAAVTASRGGRRLRSGLVVAEIALAVVLVTGAGLLLRSFVALARVDPGFETGRLVVVPLLLGADYEPAERVRFTEEVLERARALPGTRRAAAAWTTPFRDTGPGRCCWATRTVGDPALYDEARPFGGVIHPVTSGYFATLEASLAAGREFVATDTDAPVAILNRPAARLLYGREDVVGRTLTLGVSEPVTLDVVGVVEGVHHRGPTEGVKEAVYVTYARFGGDEIEIELLVRTDAPVAAAASALRDAIWAVDPDLPVPEVTTMERRVAASLATPRFLSGLVSAFGAVALLLACGGIYGSMLYTVGQRRREMGIRLALGAAGSDVARLVVRHGLVLAVAGVVLGTAAALSLAGVLDQLLWGVEPSDPLTLAAVAFLLGGSALGAALVPARRAARTNALDTLRGD